MQGVPSEMDERMLRIPSGSDRFQEEETERAKACGVCLGNICEIGLDGGSFSKSPRESRWAGLPCRPRSQILELSGDLEKEDQ